MAFSRSFKDKLRKLTGLPPLKPQWYILSYDKDNPGTSEYFRKLVLEFIIKNEGEPIKCPVKSTIIFISYYSYYEIYESAIKSELIKDIHYVVFPIQILEKNNPYVKADLTLDKEFEVDINFVKGVVNKGETILKQ